MNSLIKIVTIFVVEMEKLYIVVSFFSLLFIYVNFFKLNDWKFDHSILYYRKVTNSKLKKNVVLFDFI